MSLLAVQVQGMMQSACCMCQGTCSTCVQHLLVPAQAPTQLMQSSGWSCPKCNLVFSPSVTECADCNGLTRAIKHMTAKAVLNTEQQK
jgi:hypothetical protein